MIGLRLVDGRTGEALATWPGLSKSVDAAFAKLKKISGWKRGGLRMEDMPDSGPHFHVWAEAFDATGVKARWIWMEMRTIECIVGPDGNALPGTSQVIAGRMVWIRVDEEAARGLMTQAMEARP